EERQRKEEEAKRAALAGQVRNLQIRAHLDRNVLDPQYREKLAEHHRAKVLASKPLIFDEYTNLMNNEELLAALQEQAPEALTLAEALVDLVQLAERKEAEPHPPPPRVQLPVQRRPTEDDVRQRKVRLIKLRARDKAAETLALLDAALEFQRA